MKHLLTIAGASLAVLVAGMHGRAFAQAAPASTPPQVAKWNTDLENSRIYIKVKSSTRLGHDHGVIGRLESGWVTPGVGGELVFAMKTLITDTPEARRYVGLTAPIKLADQQKSTTNMLGAEVLDVQRFPRATFKIDTMTPADGQALGEAGTYQLGGAFTLHGVARPLALKAKLEPTTDPGMMWLRGAFALQQTQYGIKPYSAFAGVVGVEDKLEVWGEFALRLPTAEAKTTNPKVTQ